MPLLSAEFLTRLGRLGLASRRRAAGVQFGERRSNRRGNSQEFADHRPYVPGDDLRFLDWHLYGRLDALWIKLFEEEQDRVVQILIDTSASMAGEKLDQARRVAAALAAVSIARQDRVAVGGLDEGVRFRSPPRRGRENLLPVFRSIEELTVGSKTDLARAIDAWPRLRGAGIALLFTDFLHPDGPEPPLRRLLGRGLEVHVFQVVAPIEVRPAIDGDLLLIDEETGEELALTVDEGVLDRYEAQVRQWLDHCATVCHGLGVGYARVLTSTPVEDVVLTDLRRLGLVG
jgi:uncharacterized protein (DUF58 family)